MRQGLGGKPVATRTEGREPMRRWFSVAALLVGLLAVPAKAAGGPFAVSSSNNTGRMSSSVQKNDISLTSFLSSPFRLRDLFRTGPAFSNQHSFGSTKIPTPGTADYLKAFGYKKLF